MKTISHKMTPEVGRIPTPVSVDCTKTDTCSVADRTEALTKGLDFILNHHGCPDVVRGQLLDQLSKHLGICSDEEEWCKCVKHTLAYPLAKYLRCEKPKEPSRVFKATGAAKRWLKQRLICFNRKNTHLWYCWFQSKRCCLPMSDDVVEKTYEDHYTRLSRADDGNRVVIDSIMSGGCFARLLERIATKVGKYYSEDPLGFEDRQPSTNACYEQTRAEGGQQEELRRIVGLTLEDVCSPELTLMKWVPVFYGETVRSNVVLTTYERYGRDEWSRLKYRDVGVPESPPNRPLEATIQAVLEPMKVRVISKGEALPYYFMKPLQKALWRALADEPCFRLITRPFCSADMIDLRKMAGLMDQWFSIDYSAATDNLSWLYSGNILRKVISGIPARDQQFALSVLGPHRLTYPFVGRKGHTVKGVMERGQLMGSILSFPILCLANLGVYLRTTQTLQALWSDKKRLNHVLVNGDDMLYSAPEELWDVHTYFGECVGLEMSVGKAYHHGIYANINSTSVHLDLSKPKDTPWTIDYLNVGLFFGQHKVQGKSETAQSHHEVEEGTGLCTVIPEILKGALPNKQIEVMKQYISYHKDALLEETIARVEHKGHVFNRNMFLPESIGGMGVLAPAGFTFKVTAFQKRLALHLRERVTSPITTQFPLPGYPMGRHEEVLNSPWAVKGKEDSKIYLCHLSEIVPNRVQWEVLKKGFVPYGYNRCCLAA
jgi:hypothetical protein